MTQCIAMSFVIGCRSRERFVEGLLSELMKNGEDITGRLVFLPGNEPKNHQMYDNAWANGIAKKYGVYLFAEKGSWDGRLLNKGTLLFSPDARPVAVTGEQLFFTSKCDSGEYEKLASLINGGSRSITVAGRKITIVLCGENNTVEIKGVKPFSAKWRYPEFIKKNPGGILFNPIHSRMGNGGKLAERFRFLTSADGGGYQHAIALANSSHGIKGGWPKDGFSLFTQGQQVDVPIAAEFGTYHGKPRSLAFTFAL